MALEPIKKDLFERAERLEPSASALELEQIKQIIYDTSRITVRSASVKHNTIRVTVTSSPAASELYLHKHRIIEQVQGINKDLNQLVISQA